MREIRTFRDAPRTTREVTVDYLAHLGPPSACRVTIPAGTRAVRVGADWAVADVALLARLTGNSHDPQFRYCWLPADAVAEGGK